jgi:hypothetical protein
VFHQQVGFLTVLLTWNMAIAGATWFLDQLNQLGELSCFDAAPDCHSPPVLSVWRWLEAFAAGNLLFVAVVLTARRLSRRQRRR